MKGFYTTDFDQKVRLLAQGDANFCLAIGSFHQTQSYQDICQQALAFCRNDPFPFYTDDPKTIYQRYVDTFALHIAKALDIPYPNDPREVWNYEE